MRLLWRLMPALLILFSLPMLLIRAGGSEDAALRAFLTPSVDCPAPCFMGIRPGLTPIADAMAIIDAHPWTRDMMFFDPIDDPNTRYVVWQWSGEQPDWINARWQGVIRSVRGIVRGVTVQTRIQMGDVWLLFGPATSGATLRGTAFSRDETTYVSVYPAQGLLIRATLPRPAQELMSFLRATIDVESANELAIEYFSTYTMPNPCRRC